MKKERQILKKAQLCSREAIRGDVCGGVSSEVKPSENMRSRAVGQVRTCLKKHVRLIVICL